MYRYFAGWCRRLLPALVLPLLLIACTSPENSPSAGGSQSRSSYANEVYYWISQNSTLPLFVAHDQPALRAAARELGVKVRIAGPTTIDLPAFIATINQVCAQHPAGVIVVGWDPSLTAAVNQCIAERVPTVTDDADLPESNRLAFVGTDWYDIGVAQAQAMIKATGGSGEVATLSIINADNMKEAVRGFTDTLRSTNLRIVANEDDGGDASQAASKTASLLAAHPNLVGIAGFDSESGAGIVRALEEAGKAGKIKVTAMEQTPAFFQTIKKGEVQAIIIQKRELFTYYALKLLVDFNHNGLHIAGLDRWAAPPIPRIVNTGLLVATADNIDDIISHLPKQ
ncbi:substrate-binding domain-containing protein [Thermogemmatispora sp.]|uniref:substrate-binding domain-containing protein n=1 Tax=Thermogemmatispora sp. TaxID=1968838 RepID=UPI0035E44A7A